VSNVNSVSTLQSVLYLIACCK